MDPLLARVAAIEKLLTTTTSDVTPAGGQSFIDSRDAMWKQARGTEIVVIPLQKLSPTQKATYQAGTDALSLLPAGLHRWHTVCYSFAECRVRLLVPVSSLPATLSTSNAFSESYKFDPGSGKLFVRVSRQLHQWFSSFLPFELPGGTI